MRTNLRAENHTSTALGNFQGYVKRRFVKFNGLTDAKFILLLKESEFKLFYKNDNFASFVERIFGGSYERC